MALVTMRHPDLPDQPIEVDEVSVPIHQASGWQVDDNPPPTLTKARPARRRRQTGDED